MKKISRFFIGCLMAAAPVLTSAGELSLKDICTGKYSARRIYGVNPLNDGETYSRLSEIGRAHV